jgi:hypothetical protein
MKRAKRILWFTAAPGVKIYHIRKELSSHPEEAIGDVEGRSRNSDMQILEGRLG